LFYFSIVIKKIDLSALNNYRTQNQRLPCKICNAHARSRNRSQTRVLTRATTSTATGLYL